jgi:exonuclease III
VDRGDAVTRDPLADARRLQCGAEDRDVWSVKAFKGGHHVTEPERDAVARLREWGLVDAFRSATATTRLFHATGTTGAATSTSTAGCASILAW